MKLRRLLAATAAIAGLSVAGCSSAQAVTVNSTGAVGNPARYAPFVAPQQTGDCVEQSALIAMSGLRGSWVASHAGIDRYAISAGIGFAGSGTTADGGPVVDGSYVTAKLFEHYGFTATQVFGMGRSRLMADLAAGKAVQVALYAGYIWAGSGYGDGNPTPSPDHAVVVDAVNRTTFAVTISDSGLGRTYTIPWSTFSKAWATGSNDTVVVSS